MNLKLASASITSNVSSMCVVPVKVSYMGTKKQISTYALLNNCSQGCFIKYNIRKNLGVNGRKANHNQNSEWWTKDEVNTDVRIESLKW